MAFTGFPVIARGRKLAICRDARAGPAAHLRGCIAVRPARLYALATVRPRCVLPMLAVPLDMNCLAYDTVLDLENDSHCDFPVSK